MLKSTLPTFVEALAKNFFMLKSHYFEPPLKQPGHEITNFYTEIGLEFLVIYHIAQEQEGFITNA